MKSDAQYFARRAAEERAAAERASLAAAREAHLELAARYEHIERALGEGRPALHILEGGPEK